MNLKLLFLISSLLYFVQLLAAQNPSKRVVCFYDVLTRQYEGEPFFFVKKALPQALIYCTHLMYSFAEIPASAYKIRKFSINPHPSAVKKRFPHLKVFLSLGGDKPEQTNQYIKFLGAGESGYKYFAKYARTILKFQNFDGLDLAFPLPRNKPQEIRSTFDSAIMRLKSVFSAEKDQSGETNSIKIQYKNLVNVLKKDFAKAKLQLSMTVLPNVNSTFYFDIFKIQTHFEFINLFAFDFLTPVRNPKQADYTAAIYFKKEANRYPYNNIDFQVDHWIHNGCPVQKLNLGIATYGRAWRLTIDSGLSGKPIVESTDGTAQAGKYSKIPGLLSWTEICTKLATKGMLREVADKELKYGNYAFNPADKNNENGIWISFDDPYFAGVKTEYVKEKVLGGVAVYNLQNDDFLKFCGRRTFPILSRISEVLGTLQK